jgi:endo-1,4-beta-xylanase
VRLLERGLVVLAILGMCAGDSIAAEPAAPAMKSVFGAHFLVGAAIEPWQLKNPTDAALLQKHFSSITAENVMKPRTIGAVEGAYDFVAADELVRFAADNSIKLRGHTLLWHQTAPAWFFAGNRSDPQAYRALVRKRLETYITEVVKHFRGHVYAWDVVNEVASDTAGQTYREASPWYEALGPDYIEYAFRAARAADPDVALFINDYGTEKSVKRANVLAIVRDLRDKGVPIDGVGHQLHLQLDADPKGAEAALSDVEALGLINHVTELDVSLYTDPGSCSADRTGCRADYGDAIPQELFAEQAQLYGELFAVFAKHASLKSVSTWGISDAHTWLTKFPVARVNRPLLFDTTGAPKSAFWVAVRVFQAESPAQR